jgi:glycosyltransferase domain-containing protein
MESMYTLLLTLRDRTQYTKSFFDHLNQINFPEKIFVADGSSDAGRVLVQKIIKNYPNLNIEYYDFGFDSTYEQYYKKLKTSVSLIKSPYLLFIDNDDYVDVEGCIEACGIMRNDPSIVACGRVADLYLFPTIQSCKFRRSVSIIQNTPKERLACFAARPDAIWGLMLQVEGLAEVFDVVSDANFEQLHLMELLFNLNVIRRGKIARIGSRPILYRRAFSEESSSAETLKEESLLEKMFLKNFYEQWIEVENYYLGLGFSDLRILRRYWANACISQSESSTKKQSRTRVGLYSSWLIILRSLYYKLRFRYPIPRDVLRTEKERVLATRQT